jgi:hypothetical protein
MHAVATTADLDYFTEALFDRLSFRAAISRDRVDRDGAKHAGLPYVCGRFGYDIGDLWRDHAAGPVCPIEAFSSPGLPPHERRLGDRRAVVT